MRGKERTGDKRKKASVRNNSGRGLAVREEAYQRRKCV